MADLLFVGALVVFFVVALAYVRLCTHLTESDRSDR